MILTITISTDIFLSIDSRRYNLLCGLKINEVCPIDNRPSTVKLHHFVCVLKKRRIENAQNKKKWFIKHQHTKTKRNKTCITSAQNVDNRCKKSVV